MLRKRRLVTAPKWIVEAWANGKLKKRKAMRLRQQAERQANRFARQYFTGKNRSEGRVLHAASGKIWYQCYISKESAAGRGRQHWLVKDQFGFRESPAGGLALFGFLKPN
jgi:hypothetical protein